MTWDAPINVTADGMPSERAPSADTGACADAASDATDVGAQPANNGGYLIGQAARAGQSLGVAVSGCNPQNILCLQK
jgi:hypothetical protein